jgi:hypothetical protein
VFTTIPFDSGIGCRFVFAACDWIRGEFTGESSDGCDGEGVFDGGGEPGLEEGGDDVVCAVAGEETAGDGVGD